MNKEHGEIILGEVGLVLPKFFSGHKIIFTGSPLVNLETTENYRHSCQLNLHNLLRSFEERPRRMSSTRLFLFVSTDFLYHVAVVVYRL